MRDLRTGILAEYEEGDAMAAAARRLYDRGFERVVTFTPYPIRGLNERIGMGRTRLPLITLIAGLSGAVFAYWLQWYTNAVNYPINVGGRPLHSGPAFILITFETTVLFASCTGFIALFFLLGMPRLWHPTSEIDGFERATIDRFWVGVPSDDPRFDRVSIEDALSDSLRIVHLEEPA